MKKSHNFPIFSKAIEEEIAIIWGKFDLEDVRDELRSQGFDKDEYRGVELWLGDYDLAVAISDKLIVGKEEQVKNCIKVMKNQNEGGVWGSGYRKTTCPNNTTHNVKVEHEHPAKPVPALQISFPLQPNLFSAFLKLTGYLPLSDLPENPPLIYCFICRILHHKFLLSLSPNKYYSISSQKEKNRKAFKEIGSYFYKGIP